MVSDPDDPLQTGNKEAKKECPPVVVEPAEKPKESAVTDGGGEEEPWFDSELRVLSDQQLSVDIARFKSTLRSVGKNLPDDGQKLRVSVMRYEAELRSRKFRKDDDKCRKPDQRIDNRICTGELDFAVSRDRSSVPSSLSIYSSHFCSKDDNTAHLTTIATGKDISTSYLCSRKKKRKDNKSQKGSLSLTQTRVQASDHHHSVNIAEKSLSNGERKRFLSPTPSPRHFGNDLSGHCRSKRAACVEPLQNMRGNHETAIVLEDEEESDIPEKNREADGVFKKTQIFYPSRDDPESVEICYSDLKCLAPESHVSSAIMNYYIRYLQKPASSRDTKRHEYHFFNTYFYKKLKQEVLRKSEREASFVKFRRWWKGVDIFDKAYIFLPIHESLHWSLVIICIPDKKDESGPILLHLDSLKLHHSKSIFNNVKSFIVEEWKVLRQGESKSQFLIPDKIWQNLSRRINEKIIEVKEKRDQETLMVAHRYLDDFLRKVPQQENEYDCGLFVLYFMQRFLEDAPERLKKDLAMFGRRWFKSEEASSLRRKIRILLEEKFEDAECE